MAIETILVHGSDGEVMAPAGKPGVFIRGKHVLIRVTATGTDPDTPFDIRAALVGLVVETIFTKEQLGKNFAMVPDGSRLAYRDELCGPLRKAGRNAAADRLEKLFTSSLDMYVFEPGTFELA